MRALLATSISAACMAALALPLAFPSGATATVHTPVRAATPDTSPGATRTLPLAPLATSGRVIGAPLSQGLPARAVRPFSMIGITWDDVGTDLRGTVQVRTRATGTGTWSKWRTVEAHSDDAPDAGSSEGSAAAVRGSTSPLWVGRSDGVEVRVVPEAPAGGRRGVQPGLPKGLRLEMVDPGDEPGDGLGDGPGGDLSGDLGGSYLDPDAALDPGPAGPGGGVPHGDGTTDGPDGGGAFPGEPSGGDPAETDGPSGGDPSGGDPSGGDPFDGVGPSEGGYPLGGSRQDGTTTDNAADPSDDSGTPVESPFVPALSRSQTEAVTGQRFTGGRPRIVTRFGWGADEQLRSEDSELTDAVSAIFVHHTATGNDYECSDSPSVIRGIYRYHVKSSGWRDIGYNFLVDKCGNIYEGRSGGVSKAVFGAHTLGFNEHTMGIAVLGDYSEEEPSRESLSAVAGLAAWKLGIYGHNPEGMTYLVSGGSNKYPKGTRVRMNVISGHRDGFATQCPGTELYDDLGIIRRTAAGLQGR
ncbi:peptidoglycan recognition protein [Actinacidiphila glaucinigra]|uniref:peptidoglycan recognition protein family protein n=1 Tax=Actinacidiphila glaucinigra TaxID=235986 RepID=UPI002DDA77BA|nr:peptidoglycan recognition protein [Actinacidiphila glaucinigra]WSD61805.1 peptidoglycan recognition protein [Actinacidiphila glaucinigra]